MSIFKTYSKKLYSLLENAGLNRAARQLDLMSDRQLADIGISRAKLQYGAAAYPWRVEDNIVELDINNETISIAEQSTQQQAA